jgi:hypothetical protein
MDECVPLAQMQIGAPELRLFSAANSRLAVIAAEEGRADPVVWVKHAASIVAVGGHPAIVARGIGGDRKENWIVPPRAPVREMVAPRANAVFERQRIKAKPAVRIADKICIPPPPAVRDPSAAVTETLDISACMSAACVPVMGVRFVVCWRRGSGRQCAGRDH